VALWTSRFIEFLSTFACMDWLNWTWNDLCRTLPSLQHPLDYVKFPGSTLVTLSSAVIETNY